MCLECLASPDTAGVAFVLFLAVAALLGGWLPDK